MKNLSDIMKQAQAMQDKMAEVQSRLDSIEVSGFSGGDMVSVVLDGKYLVKRLKIDPNLIDKDQSEILEDLIAAAFNDAISRLETRKQEEIGEIAGGLNIPSGFKLPF